ncbi:MAG: CinA family nicotinamide mononucleotide deamidase-related protein [Flavisolibacter sp.]|jgi:nicotinamide-nucleotide amidase
MQQVNASIITIGDELLIGQTVDTNSAFIGKELNRIGIWVKKRVAVGDVKEDILNALESEGKDSEIVIITGGLGPTADDITKPTLCIYFGSKLVTNELALQNVQDIFTKLNRPLIARNLTQAEVPDNCTILQNSRGTAPGMWFEKKGVIYISLPGVPNEMKGLMLQSVIPELQKRLKLPGVLHRTLLTSGVGESTIADRIEDFENSLPQNIKLAYLPAYGLVRLRLTGKGSDKKKIEKELDGRFIELQKLVQEWLVANEDISLQDAVSRKLRSGSATVATAESCTGGYIAQLITSLPGSSSIFNGSVVAYSNESKIKMLDVHEETLKKYGAVSELTVQEMVRGAIKKLNTTYAIATSGIMGPDGGSDEKPVGTVWIAVGNEKTIKSVKHFFRFDRQRNIEMAASTALTMLFRFVTEQEKEH